MNIHTGILTDKMSTPVHVDLLSFTYQRQIRQSGGTYSYPYLQTHICICVYGQTMHSTHTSFLNHIFGLLHYEIFKTFVI